MTLHSTVVSIILPVFNAEAYLVQCMENLLNQTFKDIEVICINDGSTDESLGILQGYAKQDLRIKLIDQENTGPAGARNQGLAVAIGQYIMFCDSDDWYELNMCERMVATIKAINVDLVICDVNTVKDDENYQRGDEDYHQLRLFGYYALDDFHKSRVNGVLWNKIFKRSIVEQYSMEFPTNFAGEDGSFIFQYMCTVKNVFGLEEKLYSRRLRDGSIMDLMFGGKARFDGLHTQRHNFNFLTKNKLWHQNRYYFIWSVYDVFINNIGRFQDEDRLECLKITHNIVKYIDFNALEVNADMRGVRELTEIKENNFSRFIPQRKNKLLFSKEKYMDISHTYFLGLKIFTKKQNRYLKEIYLFEIRVYKKSNFNMYMIDELKKINEFLVRLKDK